MRTGRPIPPLTLTEDERDTLERWARRPTTARALAERARLVLECAAGKTNTVVARELRLTKQTVGKWRTRFLGQRLAGLLDEPRPGEKARAPLADGLLGQAQFARDDGIRLAGGALEHQARALGEGAGGRRSECPTLQRVAFVLGEGQRGYRPSRAHGRSSFYRRNARRPQLVPLTYDSGHG